MKKAAIVDRYLFGTALFVGVMAIVWIGIIFVDSGALALAVIAVIGIVYSMGGVELVKFRHATATLSGALFATNGKVDNIDQWLDQIDPSLRTAVHRRIQGEPVGLPSPMMTPYLVGLLVMLGLLGTFVGMVDTLRGAVLAIEGTTELQAIRDGLATPIQGLGLAFGTSVAGVASSAMLGLMSTLCRRRRVLESRELDAKIPTIFQDFSRIHHQQETFRALQVQTQALPAVADKLDAMASQLGRLGEMLIQNQDRFHLSVRDNFTELTGAMDKAFKDNLTESMRLVGLTIQPIVAETMDGINRDTQKVHSQLGSIAKAHIESSSRLFTAHAEDISRSWKAALEAHDRSIADVIEQMDVSLKTFGETFNGMANTATSQMQAETAKIVKSSQDMIRSRAETEAVWLEGHHRRMDALGESLKADLGALRDDEAQRGQAAINRLEKLESVVASHLETLGKALEEPMARLMETASEAPQVAAQVIEHLQQQALKRIDQDNRILDEHRRLMENLDTLSDTMTGKATEQGQTIEQLASQSKAMMEDVGHRFSDQVDKKISVFNGVADTLAGSAAEMASLGEAFGAAVELFNTSNGELIENLNKIEASLEKAASRSDDQLGYYVAQARDMIDHSILSQKEIVNELRELRQPNSAPNEVDQWKD